MVFRSHCPFPQNPEPIYIHVTIGVPSLTASVMAIIIAIPNPIENAATLTCSCGWPLGYGRNLRGVLSLIHI
eukprot:2289276-Alexandrium_andersonii.AAC.1